MPQYDFEGGVLLLFLPRFTTSLPCRVEPDCAKRLVPEVQSGGVGGSAVCLVVVTIVEVAVDSQIKPHSKFIVTTFVIREKCNTNILRGDILFRISVKS